MTSGCRSATTPRCPAVSTDSYAATELPYDGGELSMLVIVPEEASYDNLEARLADGLVTEIDATAREGAVELFLPRFESNSNLDLRELMEGPTRRLSRRTVPV